MVSKLHIEQLLDLQRKRRASWTRKRRDPARMNLMIRSSTADKAWTVMLIKGEKVDIYQ